MINFKIAFQAYRDYEKISLISEIVLRKFI